MRARSKPRATPQQSGRVFLFYAGDNSASVSAGGFRRLATFATVKAVPLRTPVTTVKRREERVMYGSTDLIPLAAEAVVPNPNRLATARQLPIFFATRATRAVDDSLCGVAVLPRVP